MARLVAAAYVCEKLRDMHVIDKPFAISRRQILRHSALLGGGALVAGWPLGAQARDARDIAASWPGVAALIEDYVGTGKLPNMVAALGWGQAAPDILARGQRSFAGGGAAGPDTIYRIYSMTKPITGMAAMICVAEGLLRLDQPIAELLPAFADMQVQKDYDGAITPDNLEPAKRLITLRHLLTHTAGLGYLITQQGPIRDAYASAGIAAAYLTNLPLPPELPNPVPAPSLAAFADNLAQLPLVVQPGEQWLYSASFDLLARVIEVASGQDFGSFLQERLLDPCGMDSTGFQLAAGNVDRFTANYVLLGGMPLPIDLPESSVFLGQPAFPFGGGGLLSTARDYDRFLQMLAGYGMIDGKRVMSEAAVRMGTSDLSPATQVPGGGFEGGVDWGHGAGGLAGKAGRITEGMFGWGGAAGTMAMVNLRIGLRMSLMTQYMPAETYPMHRDFPRIAMADAQLQTRAMRAR